MASKRRSNKKSASHASGHGGASARSGSAERVKAADSSHAGSSAAGAFDSAFESGASSGDKASTREAGGGGIGGKQPTGTHGGKIRGEQRGGDKHRLTLAIEAAINLSLAIWLGSAVMFAFAAAGTFGAIRQSSMIMAVSPNPTVPTTYLEPDQLAGDVVNQVAEHLWTLALICAVIASVGVLVQGARQWMRGLGVAGRWTVWGRAVLVLGAGAVLAWQLVLVQPAMDHWRGARDEPGISQRQRDSASAQFDRWHTLSERSLSVTALLVLGAVVLSPAATLHLCRSRD